ncbi:methyltransferase domain-containing protein [Epibacterium ulvae]|uniref:methyltransferase domain-containing protein n=1 Tax=Epibacterium ulvae TaxID=1156985 RepID=UPI0024908A4B|nr:methyltransferase domain-containing protein [Epibacterium ulvae]
MRSYNIYDDIADSYGKAHARWLRFAGGEAQCAFEGAVTALLRPDVRLLDVACGTGTVARRLIKGLESRANLVLLDASQKMLDCCDDIPAQRVIGCMKNLPFRDDSFDLLTCAWGLETLDDPYPALSEFVRVTRCGGHVCIVFCADRQPRSIADRMLRHRISQTGRGSFLVDGKMRELAMTAGARRVQSLHCSGSAAAMILHI